jgi:hypothetical protein
VVRPGDVLDRPHAKRLVVAQEVERAEVNGLEGLPVRGAERPAHEARLNLTLALQIDLQRPLVELHPLDQRESDVAARGRLALRRHPDHALAVLHGRGAVGVDHPPDLAVVPG